MAVLLVAVVIYLLCRRRIQQGTFGLDFAGKTNRGIVNNEYESVTETDIVKRREETHAENSASSIAVKRSVVHRKSSSRPLDEEVSTQTQTTGVQDKQTEVNEETGKHSGFVHTDAEEEIVETGNREAKDPGKQEEEDAEGEETQNIVVLPTSSYPRLRKQTSRFFEKSDGSTQTQPREVHDKQTATREEVSVQTSPEDFDSAEQDDEEEEKAEDRAADHLSKLSIAKEEEEAEEEEKVEEEGEDAQVVRKIPPPFERRKSRDDITFTSGWRREVKLTELMRAKLILETRVEELEREEVTEEEVEKELAPFLIGRYPIAGVLVIKTGQKMALYDAFKQGIITRGTAVSLLEAQAAVGSIIDPWEGSKMSVDEAQKRGLINARMASVIIRAEGAVTGYKSRSTKETLSLFQAMKRNLVVESHGIRLLEAQIATGGIIDPQANCRLPVEVAYKRGLLDERLHRMLEDPSDDTKGFLDPNTGDNLTYLELIQRCVEDKETGHLLLPLVPEEERRNYLDRYSNASYASSRSPTTLSPRTFSSGSESASFDDDVTS